MATQIQTTDTTPNPMPTWLSIPIILICLVGGGWLVHWYIVSDPLSHDVKVLAEPAKTVSQTPARGLGRLFGNGPGGGGQGNPGQGGLPGMGTPGGPPGAPNRNQWNATPHMHQIDAQRNQWELKTDAARLDVSYEKSKLNIRSITFNNFSFLPEDLRTQVKAVRTISTNIEIAEQLKLKAGDVKNLHSLAFSVNAMVVAPADKELLGAELTKFLTGPESDRAGLEPQLYKTLDEIAQRSAAPTVKVAGDRLQEINKIMTPELWSQYATLPPPTK